MNTGATRFFRGFGEDEPVQVAVQPEPGLVVIFPHALCHDGELCQSDKYLLRSDLMFPLEEQEEG